MQSLWRPELSGTGGAVLRAVLIMAEPFLWPQDWNFGVPFSPWPTADGHLWDSVSNGAKNVEVFCL